jgi:hypothetical protein
VIDVVALVDDLLDVQIDPMQYPVQGVELVGG